MNRVDRLFAILLMLQQTQRVRAIDLAERFGISPRTVYRDMHALQEMGIPLISLPGEGYELLEGYRLPPMMLTGEEATALFLAGRMLIRNSEGDITAHAQAALQKVITVLSPTERGQIEQMARIINFFPAQHPLNLDDSRIPQLIDAIENEQTLHIHYRAYRDNNTTERDFDPYDLTYSDGAWYVNGYCHLRRDMRSFRVNRISNVAVTPHTFEKRLMIPAETEPIEVRVQFSAAVTPHVREKQHYAFVDEHAHRTMIFHVHTLDEIRNWILGFGAEAHVIAPESLRTWIHDEAKRLIKLLT